MNDYNRIKLRIELIFKELKIAYEVIDFVDDEDLNYIVDFNTYGRLKSLNSIRGIIYFHNDNFSMNFIVGNIYSSCDKDEINIYEIVNDVNAQLLHGSFLIDENKNIFYRSSINCGNDYNGLDKQILKRQIDVFLDGLARLFDILKSKE